MDGRSRPRDSQKGCLMNKRKRLDKLAAALRDVSPQRMRELLVKDTTVNLRITQSDKADMQRVSKFCRLTLTEYLTRLHVFASQRLFVDTTPQRKGR